jgi:hypothetical protein
VRLATSYPDSRSTHNSDLEDHLIDVKSSMTASWETELTVAVRDSKATFESIELVGNEARTAVAIALLHVFGNDPATRIFAESRKPDRSRDENVRPTKQIHSKCE